VPEESFGKKGCSLPGNLYSNALSIGRVSNPCIDSQTDVKEADNIRVSGDEELNIILLRLLEYFGHANPYVCAVAYTEVSSPFYGSGRLH
jgi:hypothetical protein